MQNATREGEFLRDVVLSSTRPIVTIDETDHVVYANDAVETELGWDPDSLVNEPVYQLFENGQRVVARAWERTEKTGRETEPEHGHGASLRTPRGEQVHATLGTSVTERDGIDFLTLWFEPVVNRSSPISEAVVDRDPRSAMEYLAALGKGRAALDAADEELAIARTGVAFLQEEFGVDLCCIRFETDDNSLEPVAMSDGARTLVDTNPGFELGLSAAGRAYRTGTPVIREEADETVAPDLLGASIHYPIENYGVLTVATDRGRGFNGAKRNALRFFVGGLTVRLDQLTQERQLREHSAELQAREEQLERVTDISTLVCEIIGALAEVDSRDEAERLVCSELAAAKPYLRAWIATLKGRERPLRVTETAGFEDGPAPFDEWSLDELGDEAIRNVTESGDLHVLTVKELVGESDDTDLTLTAETEMVSLVPLMTESRSFGVLGVHGTGVESGDGIVRQCLTVLGKTLAFTLDSLENEDILLSDRSVELTFRVTDRDCLSVALSEDLDTSVRMEKSVQAAHGEHLSYVQLEGTDPDEALPVAESLDAVRDCRIVTEYDEDCLLEVTRPSSGAEVMMDFGATMRSAEADSGTGTLVLEAPQSVDVRAVVEAYQKYNPQSELVSKRDLDRPVRTARQLGSAIESTLTRKQQSAISAAYFSGYYAWPRESTAEEIADSMGITASTLHQHLRRGHQKILSELFESSL
jgi:PAS domain S-box-containing protein